MCARARAKARAAACFRVSLGWRRVGEVQGKFATATSTLHRTQAPPCRAGIACECSRARATVLCSVCFNSLSTVAEGRRTGCRPYDTSSTVPSPARKQRSSEPQLRCKGIRHPASLVSASYSQPAMLALCGAHTVLMAVRGGAYGGRVALVQVRVCAWHASLFKIPEFASGRSLTQWCHELLRSLARALCRA